MKMLKKFAKKILLLVCTTFIVGNFISCAFIQLKSPKVSDIINNVKKISNLSNMEEGNKSKLRKLYSIDFKALEEFVLYAPKTNMEANEILILKVKNQDDMDKLQELVEKRIEKQSSSFKSYKPDQYDLLENRTLKVKGKYLILVVSKDVDKITKTVEDTFR